MGVSFHTTVVVGVETHVCKPVPTLPSEAELVAKCEAAGFPVVPGSFGLHTVVMGH